MTGSPYRIYWQQRISNGEICDIDVYRPKYICVRYYKVLRYSVSNLCIFVPILKEVALFTALSPRKIYRTVQILILHLRKTISKSSGSTRNRTRVVLIIFIYSTFTPWDHAKNSRFLLFWPLTFCIFAWFHTIFVKECSFVAQEVFICNVFYLL